MELKIREKELCLGKKEEEVLCKKTSQRQMTLKAGRGVFIPNLMTLRKTASAWHDLRHFAVLSEAQREPC